MFNIERCEKYRELTSSSNTIFEQKQFILQFDSTSETTTRFQKLEIYSRNDLTKRKES